MGGVAGSGPRARATEGLGERGTCAGTLRSPSPARCFNHARDIAAATAAALLPPRAARPAVGALRGDAKEPPEALQEGGEAVGSLLLGAPPPRKRMPPGARSHTDGR